MQSGNHLQPQGGHVASSFMARAIDPCLMNHEQSRLLGQLLSSNLNAMIFTDYQRLNNSLTLLFLEKSIYRYRSRKIPQESRYGVAGRILGIGGFGSVYEITHTLKMASDGRVICKQKADGKKRVVKVYKSDPTTQAGQAGIQAVNEAAMLNMAGTMNTRQVQKSKNGNMATLVMRYIEGESLDKCVMNHQLGLVPLTIMQRLILSSRLCFALQEQVHRRGLVHRDIKLDNIMVSKYPDGNIKEITIIDYNLSKLESRDDTGESVGTTRYASPEAFAAKMTRPASDIYSMGRVLWQLWGMGVNYYDSSGLNRIFFYMALNMTTGNAIPSLFYDVPSTLLPIAYKRQIETMLLRINARAIAERPALDEVIALFDRILLQMSVDQTKLSAANVEELHPDPMVVLPEQHNESVEQQIIACQQKMSLAASAQMDSVALHQGEVSPAPVRRAHFSSSTSHLFAHRSAPAARRVVAPAPAAQCVLF